jgi:N6-adenosine-specific RNA methylase IME4
MPDRRYGVIVADPPWRYGVTNGARGATRHGNTPGRFSKHYPSMSARAIAALPVGDLAADSAVLLCWATWPRLPDAMAAIAAWGFEYVSGFPWIKLTSAPRAALDDRPVATPQYGIGFWSRACSEPLLIARRGDVTIRSPYLGLLSENFGHSRKPDNLYDYAEQFPGPYLELFARRPWPNWDSWGNECASVELPGLTDVHARA